MVERVGAALPGVVGVAVESASTTWRLAWQEEE